MFAIREIVLVGLDNEQSASINKKSDQEIAKENEERKEQKKERKREYQKAWRKRKKDLETKPSKEEKKEEKRKRHRENQRAYYQRTKLLQKKWDDLQMKNQENVVQCRASQNLENVQLEQNQFLTQQLRIYGESHECVTPKVLLHRTTDIPGDGNCLFHSLIRVLQLQISTCDLRRQLRDSPYLNSCHNPKEAYNILSSNNEYGDLDCLYLFAKIYNQNICVHYHYFNVISKNEDTRFCHFKANDTHNWIHLDLRELHFTPYFSDDEKRKEDERKQKQKNREYSKRYRDKKRKSNLQTGPSARDVLNLQPVIHTSQIAGPSTGGVPYVPPVICKLDSNEDQENVVQCRASKNLENVQLEQNQFLTQQLCIYGESHKCVTPKVLQHRTTDIPGDAYVHLGVHCQECNGSIINFRYTCLQCDYDICSSCEALGAHPLHYVLRVPGQKRDDVEEILQKIRDSLPPQSHYPDEEPVLHTEIKHEPPDPLEFEIEEKYECRWPHTDNEMEHTLLTLKVEPDLLEEPTPGPQELRTGPQTLEIEYQQHQLQPVSQVLEQGQQQTEPVVIKQEVEPLQQQLKPTQLAINESTPQFKDMEFAVSPHSSREVNSAQELKPVPQELPLTAPLKRTAGCSAEPHKRLHSSTETSKLQDLLTTRKNYVNTRKKKS